MFGSAAGVPVGGELGEAIAESAALSSTYRGYIWSQLFAKNLAQEWCFFAMLLDSGDWCSSG